MDNIVIALAYRSNGAAYQESAKILCSNLELNQKNIPKNYLCTPFYYLCSHAAELYLKAALLKRNYDVEKLKKFDFRHNLQALLDELIDNRKLEVTKNTRLTISALHSQHEKHALRYNVLLDDGNNIVFPPVCCCLEMLDELLMLTRINTQGK